MIIADPPRPSHRRSDRVALVAALVAVGVGSFVAWWYVRAGLTLSHYDAKAHLVVARRVIDSLTPGWKQIGAVWLPLPHLLNLLPVQVNFFYETGAFAVAMSVLEFGVIAYACARLVMDATGSWPAAAAGLGILLLNPDLLYLQSTPMTEPLLLALTTMSAAMLFRWIESDGTRHGTATGVVIALACLSRYEAWPVTAAALALSALALWRRGIGLPRAAGLVGRMALFPAAAGLAFLVQSRLTVGRWFVTGGFYVADNPDMGRPFKTLGSLWWASHHLNGYGVLIAAVAGAAGILAIGLWRRDRCAALVTLALAGSAALPWYAFYIGHPFRFRYMIPLVPALAVWAGIGIGLTRRFHAVSAAVLAVLVAAQTRPLDAQAPMVLEAQLDRQHGQERRVVTAYLRQHRHGELMLASLGSLSHYVHELSEIGVGIGDVVHEGNGDLWAAAVERPESHVGWVVIEELARGGDRLAERARQHPDFLAGFERVAEGGGVALYQRSRAAAPAANPQ